MLYSRIPRRIPRRGILRVEKNRKGCPESHLKDISQHHAALGRFLGLQLFVGQGVSHFQSVAQEVQLCEARTQGEQIEQHEYGPTVHGQGDAGKVQQHVAVGQQACQEGNQVVPPKAQVQLEQAESAAPHKAAALPEGEKRADLGTVVENVVRHAVAVENGHQGRQHHRQENGDQRAGGGIKGVQRVFVQGDASAAEQAASGEVGHYDAQEAAGEGQEQEQERGKVARAYDNGHQKGHQQQLQPQQGPEALKARPQGVAGGVLPSGDADHAAHVAEAQAHGENSRENGQKVGHGRKKIPAVHTRQSAGAGDAAGQEKLQQGADAADAQGQGGVGENDLLFVLGLLQPLAGHGFQISGGEGHIGESS